jgi:hypothetical protein
MSPSVSPRRWAFISRSPKAEFELSSTSSIFDMYIDSHYRQYSVSRAGVLEWFAMSPITSMSENGYGEGNEVGKGENTG